MKINLNSLVGNACTLLTFKTPFPIFRENHLFVHHPPLRLATMADTNNTPYIIEDLGLSKGQPEAFYPRQLRRICRSYKLYWGKFWSQLRYLGQAPLYYKLSALLFLATCVLVMISTQTWQIGLLWVIPTQLGSHLAALFQQLVEHSWFYEAKPGEGVKSQIINKCLVVYLGSAPPTDKNLLQWLIWSVEMFVFQPFIRMTVLPVTLPAHALHHALPNEKDWANQTHRLREFQSGRIPGWKSYRFQEVWGYPQALAYIFRGLSQSKALAQSRLP